MKSVSRFLPVQRAGLAVAALIAIAGILSFATTAVAQETTGRLAGTVTMKVDKSALPGVLVEAVHTPTGTRYSATTLSNGRFTILNVRVGGPYTIVAKLSGFKEQTVKGIEVALGEIRNVSLELDLATVTETVEVTASESPLINPDRMGNTATVAEEQLKSLPTVQRTIQNVARTNPYFNVDPGDQSGTRLNVAGKNNRYNTIQIDGAVNNDLFGLADTGTPGGQANTQPISLDAIQELQLVVSPYDIKQGGFTGGGINAITRSGSNEFSASVYGSIRSESFVSDYVPQSATDALDRPVSEFSEDQYGLRVGGPILRDRLFFFASGEINRRSAPTGVAADGSAAVQYNSSGNLASAPAFRDLLIAKYNYDPGSLGDFNQTTDSNLIFGRLDFNASTAHQITLRHNYIDGVNDVVQDRSATRFRFQTGIYAIENKTNSTVLQVNSVFGANAFNVGRIGYQTIRDARATAVIFPTVDIGPIARQPQLSAGTERFSGANSLDQDVLEITDDFTLLFGNHTITIGTHNEIFDFKNLFLSDFYGWYRFSTLADFEKGIAQEYSIGFATGSDPRRPASFGSKQWGFYVGDQWRVNNSLTLNFGIRADIPTLDDTPSRNEAVFTTFGIDTSDVPSSDLIISPRFGFNWSPGPTQQVRGGIGVFAGRTPYVWISNVFANTGVESLTLTARNIQFNPDPYGQPKNFPPGTAAITVDAIDPDFKMPRVLRTTLAYDRELPGGVRATVEGMYTKTLEDVYYLNPARIPDGTKAFDGRPRHKAVSTGFQALPYLTNTDEGRQTNLTLQLEKRFDFGLYVNASYAYTNAKSAFDGTSSRAISNWQFHHTRGDIQNPELSRTAFEIEDRFNFVISQSFKTGPVRHTVAFLFNVTSGQPYSIMMGGDPNSDGYSTNDLIYVPANFSDFILRNPSGSPAPTEEQWEQFLGWTGLDKYRGQIVPRYSSFTPWNRSLDFHYDLEVPVSVVRTQLTFDVLNLINLIDKNSGGIYSVGNQNWTPLNYVGIDSATGKPIYQMVSAGNLTGGAYFSNDLRSRWQMKFGLRLSY